MRCKGIISSTHRLSRKILIRGLTCLRLSDYNFETIVLFPLVCLVIMITFAGDFTKCKEIMKKEKNNCLTPIDASTRYEGFGEGFYLHNGKNGVIRQGQYMIVKESDGFACSIYLPAECMMIHVLSFYYRVPYTITTKTPEIILTDINSRVYGGWNIFMRACNILSNENAVDNLPYASALLLNFIEAERYVKNEGVDAGSTKSELVEKAIQYMYDNIRKDISIADLLEHLGCSRSKLFRHFRDYKTARPLEFLNEIRIKRACKLLTDTSLHRGGNQQSSVLHQIVHKDYRHVTNEIQGYSQCLIYACA